MPRKRAAFDFEKALQELEKLVEKMEHGDLSLDEALKCFERGMVLTRGCQQILGEAEQKIKILLTENDTAKLQPFTPNEEPSNPK